MQHLRVSVYLCVFGRVCMYLRVFARMCVYLLVFARICAYLRVSARICEYLPAFSSILYVFVTPEGSLDTKFGAGFSFLFDGLFVR